MDFDIVKIGRYDAILGQTWWWQYDMRILPGNHILHFHKGKKLKLYGHKVDNQIPLVLAMQFKRVARKINSQTFGLFLSEVNQVEKKEKECPLEMAHLLEE